MVHRKTLKSYCVSIHAFREGRRRVPVRFREPVQMFQSTPSAREGDLSLPGADVESGVSIHAFREGRRPLAMSVLTFLRSFNPRLPRGKATA